ncbi:hypothetical protein [Vibrio ezurae]|nr:hypothetical protein [Vibrio ezurae]
MTDHTIRMAYLIVFGLLGLIALGVMIRVSFVLIELAKQSR